MENRIIKFRAWNKEEKKMLKPFTIWQVSDEIDEIDLFEEGHILMQFTGFKDKNGIEIYEGDIVRYKFMSGFDCGWENGQDWDKNSDAIEEKIGKVVFRDGEFYPREIARIVEDGYYSYRLFDFEVIGNAYENPELLN